MREQTDFGASTLAPELICLKSLRGENLMGTRLKKHILANERGNVAMIFALAIIPVFAVAGFAIDFQITIKQKQRVQLVVDSAVLAAARAKQFGSSEQQIKTVFTEYFEAQIDPSFGGMECQSPTVNVLDSQSEIDATVNCSQQTTLMNIIGQSKMDFTVRTASSYGIDKLDVAFMFDITGSMNSNSRLKNLKAAAQEALDVLLPEGAPAELIEDTRIAMVSYNTMVDAGDYFEEVTGFPATRTYSHTLAEPDIVEKLDEGTRIRDLDVRFYNASTQEQLTRLGDDAVIGVEDWKGNRTRETFTVAIEIPPSSPLHGNVRSMRLELSGRQSKRSNQNSEPYTLYGLKRGNYRGAKFREGSYKLRMRAYSEKNRKGDLLYDERIDFEIVKFRAPVDREKSITISSTCVWERDGPHKFTDGAPAPGSYLAHQQAWFIEDEDHDEGGYWKIGHPALKSNWYDGDECRPYEPIGLTNNRNKLSNYIKSLTAGGGTAGHLGVAWSWYLVSENWKGVFTGDSEPMAYSEPDSIKAVILMTDGSFNSQLFSAQGSSDAQARNVCDEMKKTPIQVFAVALNAPQQGKDVLKYCASGEDYYFEPESAAELTDAYRKIATAISDLRISK